MKKQKILFATCVALFASICFIGCNQNPREPGTDGGSSSNSESSSNGGSSSNGESSSNGGAIAEDDFTEIDEFKPAAGTYDIEQIIESKSKENGVEKSNTIEQYNGTLVIKGTNDDSNVSQTLSSMSGTMSFKSKDDYNEAKEQSKTSPYKYDYDDKNLTIKCTVTGINQEDDMTYFEFLSTFSELEGADVKFYSSSKGSYKIVMSEKEEFTNEENEKVEYEYKITTILTRK